MSKLAPFVKAYNNQGNEINLGKITRFVFVHSEELDDHSMIELQTLDPNLIDQKDFNEGAKFRVIFGFIGGKKSKTYTLFLIDTDPKYTPEGIIITLKLGDKAQYMKHTSDKAMLEGDPEDLIKNLAAKNGVAFKGVESSGYLIRGKVPVYNKTDQFYSAAVDNTAVPILRKVNIPQGNKSDMAAVQEIMDVQPGGPWIVTGHNDELVVKNRNFLQKVFRTYKYLGYPEGLVSFAPSTRNKSNKKTSTGVNVNSWDSLKKEYYEGRITQANSSNMILNKTVEMPNAGTIKALEAELAKTEAKQKAGELISPKEGAYAKWAAQVITSYKDSADKVKTPNNNPEDDIWNQLIYAVATDVDFLYKPIQAGGQFIEESLGIKQETREIKDVGNGKKWSYRVLDRQTPSSTTTTTTKKTTTVATTAAVDNTNVISHGYELVDIKQNQQFIPENTPEENATKAINERENASIKSNSAEVVVLGDPEVESGYLFGLLNVSKKYSGKWYIVTARHEIDFTTGYLLKCHVVTNSFGKTGNEAPTTISASDLNVPTNNNLLESQQTIYKVIQ